MGNQHIWPLFVAYNEQNVARLRLLFMVLFVTLLAAVPNITFAAGFFGPVLPQSGSCFCNGGPLDWGCVFQVLQNLIQLAVSLGVIMCVMWIAYAGFSLMVSGGNPQALSEGKNRAMNAVVGILVILCAWLIVDFVMKVVYEPTKTFDGGTFGPWNAILASSGSDFCIRPTTPSPLTNGEIIAGNPSGVTSSPGISPGSGQVGSGGRGTALCAPGNTACSVAALQGEGLSQAQAQAMSCIAVTESGGNPNIGGSGTGAQGLFQITATNWRNAAYHRNPCSAASSRDDAACNRQAAVLMFMSGGYQPWTGKCEVRSGCGNVGYGQYWNPSAVSCVAHYDPGH